MGPFTLQSSGRCVSDMLNCLGWKTLQTRRTIARLCLLYKFRNNLAYVVNANFTQLHILLHAHMGMLLSYPLLSVIFINFPSFQDP